MYHLDEEAELMGVSPDSSMDSMVALLKEATPLEGSQGKGSHAGLAYVS